MKSTRFWIMQDIMVDDRGRRICMKEKLFLLIEELSENQLVYAYTFLTKLFGKVGVYGQNY